MELEEGLFLGVLDGEDFGVDVSEDLFLAVVERKVELEVRLETEVLREGLVLEVLAELLLLFGELELAENGLSFDLFSELSN